jgi:hypothetical protein
LESISFPAHLPYLAPYPAKVKKAIRVLTRAAARRGVDILWPKHDAWGEFGLYLKRKAREDKGGKCR